MTVLVGRDERRRRIATRHRLAPAYHGADEEDVVRSLVAVHATDPATVFLSLAARLARPDPEAIEEALNDRRALARMHGMRRTVFVVPSDVAPLVQASSLREITRRERQLLVRLVAAGGFDEQWLDDVLRSTLAAVRTLGEATTSELSALEPRLREQIEVNRGKAYGGRVGVGSRVLTFLAMNGDVVRGRTIGGWRSHRYRWAPAPARELDDEDVAAAELIRRYLAAYGPATEADLKWWTGWSLGKVRAALAGAGVEAVALDDGQGFVVAGDSGQTEDAGDWAALLPALDTTVMGWRDRGWYLPANASPLYDRSGNLGPTVWWNGEVVGGWAQRPDGHVVWRALADVGRAARTAIDAEAERTSSWLGDTVVTPRFRTPLERELAAPHAQS